MGLLWVFRGVVCGRERALWWLERVIGDSKTEIVTIRPIVTCALLKKNCFSVACSVFSSFENLDLGISTFCFSEART